MRCFYMIVLHKKRLILITTMICISLTVFLVNGSLPKTQTIETVNLPVSNKVIVLDAGHGVPDERGTK